MSKKTNQKLLTVGSLFSGIGGLELGLEWTGGFKTVWQVENNDYAQKVLKKHWPDVFRWGDVTTFPPNALSKRWKGFDKRWVQPVGSGIQAIPEAGQKSIQSEWVVDLICGGFPCQDISFAGKGAGLSGARSGLWFEFARIIRILRPQYVLIENVAALFVRGIDVVLGTLAEIGYDAEWHCIPAAAVGAPHIRDRVFIVAYAMHSGSRCDGFCVDRSWSQKSQKRHRVTGVESSPQSTTRQNREQFCSKMADARQLRIQQRRTRGKNISEGGGLCGSGGNDGRAKVCCESVLERQSQQDNWWSTQCRLGIHPDGLSGRLDGCRGWECRIPRVIEGQKNRVDRLRCLGNAVVPQVAQWIGQQILDAENKKDQ